MPSDEYRDRAAAASAYRERCAKPRGLCINCGKCKAAYGRRGLCKGCSEDVDIRERFDKEDRSDRMTDAELDAMIAEQLPTMPTTNGAEGHQGPKTTRKRGAKSAETSANGSE